MRRAAPQKTSNKQNITVPASLVVQMEQWKKNHENNAREDRRRAKEQHSDISSFENTNDGYEMMSDTSQNAEIKFTLQTGSGILSFKQTDNKYTDFVRVIIQMLMTFNENEIDLELRQLIKRALVAYEQGEDFSMEDEDFDFYNQSLFDAQQQSEKLEEIQRFVSSLETTETLTMRVLSFDDCDSFRLQKIFDKHTDFPPPTVHQILNEHTTFSLPFEKAKELYLELRMQDVILNIISDKTTTKHSAAAKTNKKIKEPVDVPLDSLVLTEEMIVKNATL